MNLSNFIGVPIFSLYKLIKKMNKDNLYQRQKINKDVHIIEIPEGKIYLIDCEGNGTGKRPIFIQKMDLELLSNEIKKIVGNEEDTEEKTETPEAPETITKKNTKK